MKRALARRLGAVEGFRDPDPGLEQYATPTELAAQLIALADLHDDLAGRTVADLGAGTGMLGIAAATRNPHRVLAVERDPDAVAVGRANEPRVEPGVGVEWTVADATRPPLAAVDTVVMNPPFGAQDGAEHADRAFLAAASEVAAVSYSVHNAGSKAFVESFAGDRGGTVTHAFAAEFAVPAQFSFHTQDRAVLDVELFRVDWGRQS
ncbi:MULTISPECIES: METTL5 family protein [Halobacterium]|nr:MULTISPECIES: METTL5 family protein [Halobacterium]MBB6090417.1 putative methylase [Halobacterium salinarum]MDL0124737.1 METTL5 family protein [Halobacterium salinarum]MDL0130737.1 METTL5 family protein [Halobacterium salinarum]MDL0136081.1 METTL5 family protein [Halobacterium salinarum]MDL0144484.1 METTL5 family protein [Halobacterium salinarum]